MNQNLIDSTLDYSGLLQRIGTMCPAYPRQQTLPHHVSKALKAKSAAARTKKKSEPGRSRIEKEKSCLF
jgi:hypothetical protein